MVHTGYNASLVALSIAIAIFASYTALDLGARVRGKAAGPRWAWVAAASIAMGGGIWAMHFVGMLAFAIAMPVTYDVGLTVLSFVIAVGVTAAAFAWVSRPSAQLRDVLLSGPLMGIGVAAMHYTGMAAMEMPGNLAYSAPVVVVSVLIAVSAATAALWLTFRRNNVWQKLLAASVMGIAVAGMHYTGMAAATFSMAADVGGVMPMGPMAMDAGGVMPMGPHPGGVLPIGQQNLALWVAGATFLILFLAMLASSIDQQRVQRALFASEERFRAAAEAVGDIIWTNDAKGEMRGLQRDWQAFTGQSQAEVQGHGWSRAVHPDDLQDTMAAWADATVERRACAFEHRVRRHDGVYRLFAVRAVPILNADTSIREWVGVHEDITAQREFETALREARDVALQASQAKSQFLANMSHELRTPLAAIIGYSELLDDEIVDAGDPGGLLSDLRKIERNARHLLGLINDVLDLSKVESGKMDIFVERFDVEPMVRDCAAAVQVLVDKNRNTLRLDLPALGAMDQDVTKIRQILLNVLSNAAKFTHDGRVDCSVRRQGDTIVFSVTDTGIGMSDEQMSRLFQRFQQADESTTRRFGGTGLGLSLTKALCDMLGGSIAVISAPARGTTVTVTMPVEAPRASPEAPEIAVETRTARTEPVPALQSAVH